MSSLSHSCRHGMDLALANPFSAIIKALDRFFRSKEITKTAKIYHGEFSYDLVPNTSISTFDNMAKVTSVDCGDCYIGVFEGARYQGQCQILKPGEKAQIGGCGSIVVSMQPIPVDVFRNNARSPAWCWELSGPMYLWHFSSNYKYV
ncbi:MAG: hypothetical protein ACOY4I_04005 [Bacillota bacterium]